MGTGRFFRTCQVATIANQISKLDVDRGPPKEVRISYVISYIKLAQKQVNLETQEEESRSSTFALVAQRLLFCNLMVTIAHAIKNNKQP